MRRVCIAFALVCLLLAGGAAGCAVEPGADSQTEREDVFQEQEIDEGIQVNGTVVTAAGKKLIWQKRTAMCIGLPDATGLKKIN